MQVGTNLKHTKAYNYRIVLNAIRVHGPIARADIARRTSLTAQTVSNITRTLLARGLIVEAERVQDGRGAPSITLRVNPNGAFAIGLDFDQEHLTAVLVDLEGNMRQRLYEEVEVLSPSASFDLMERSFRQILASEDLTPEMIWGVGIGMPGPFDIRQTDSVRPTVHPTAFPGWHEDVPVVDILTERLGLPVFLENNATAAAVGERWYGEGKHLRSFFYLFLGSGLGGGLVLNGEPFEGHSGNAGEVGYIPTWESGQAIRGFSRPHHGIHFNLPRLYRELAKHDVSARHPKDLLAPYTDRNPLLMEWIDAGATKLANLILAVEYLVDPEVIFIGGRLPVPLIEEFRVRVDALLPEMRMEEKHFVPKLRRATAGEDAAALGVATLPMYASFAPVQALLRGQHRTALTRNRSHPATEFHLTDQ